MTGFFSCDHFEQFIEQFASGPAAISHAHFRELRGPFWHGACRGSGGWMLSATLMFFSSHVVYLKLLWKTTPVNCLCFFFLLFSCSNDIIYVALVCLSLRSSQSPTTWPLGQWQIFGHRLLRRDATHLGGASAYGSKLDMQKTTRIWLIMKIQFGSITWMTKPMMIIYPWYMISYDKLNKLMFIDIIYL